VPILPDAPGLLSTMTCCPRRWPSLSATSRATVSVTPPGENGTIRRMGREGYCCAVSAACAPEPASASTAHSGARAARRAAWPRRERRGVSMGVSLLLCWIEPAGQAQGAAAASLRPAYWRRSHALLRPPSFLPGRNAARASIFPVMALSGSCDGAGIAQGGQSGMAVARQGAQYGIGRLAKFGGAAEAGGLCGRQLDRVARHLDGCARFQRNIDHHVARPHLRVGQRLAEVVDGAARNARGGQFLQPVSRGTGT